jgi:hypothetical protein
VNTVAPHLAMATVCTARALCRAPLATAPRLAAQAAGAAVLVALVAVVALAAALASATHYMTAILTELLRVARTAMAFFFALAVVVVVALAVLVHR